MKKSYLMIAAAAALFAACSSNDTFKDVDTQETPISFEPFTENVTKAAITGADNAARITALAGEGGFVVYGYKSKDNFTSKETPDIFAGKNVYWDTQSSVWKYDGLRFWDKNATYNFYAVAPYQPTDNATYTIQGDPSAANFGRITITGATSARSDRSDDYLIDRDGNKGVLGSDHTSGTNDNVHMDFHHVMAKLNFAIKSTLSSGTITVTNLSMTGWNSGAGTFTQDLTITGAPSNITCAEWNIPTAGTTGITLIGGSATDQSIAVTCGTTPATTADNYGDYVKDVQDWYIMVPQAITCTKDANDQPTAGLTFTVTYTYNDGADQNPYIETFTNQVSIVPSNQTWGTDSYTKYTLDIKPEEIKFDVTSICGFDVNGGDISHTVK